MTREIGTERRAEAGRAAEHFSAPDEHRAVVISPHGDYYCSRGKGLKRVMHSLELCAEHFKHPRFEAPHVAH